MSNDDNVLSDFQHDISQGNNNSSNTQLSQPKGDGDKPYTHEQIAKLLEFADIRTKVM